jgi:hypothetical protein
MSPRNWDFPTPFFANECAPPSGSMGGGGGGGGAYSQRVWGWGVPIPTTGKKLSTLPILCSTLYIILPIA